MTRESARGHAPDAADTARLLTQLDRWQLLTDGPAFATASSLLQPVLSEVDGTRLPAMLKLAKDSAAGDEERAGFALQRWWNGDGAAAVYRHDDDAVLLERARGRRSLLAMSLGPSAADDDHALRLLCRAVARLHAPRRLSPPPTLVPLDSWFGELFEHADGLGGSYLRGADLAAELLDEPTAPVPLHGDIHHDNVLDFDRRGWLAIDPKGLLGATEFDYANMLCNPSRAQSAEPRRLRRRVQTVSLASGINADRLLRWTIAWTALSATWFMTADGAGSADALATVAIGDAATRILLDSSV